MSPVRALAAIASAAVLGACAALGPGDARSANQVPSGFDASLIVRGAQLAAIGNCAYCHTAPGGKPFAGGLAIASSFGTLYSTNISPDPDTGIGGWSLEDFTAAMREGVDRRGRHLYPAFPYDHFTLVTDDDIKAIYAFVMSRDPVREEARRNRLTFPFNMRLSAAAWKLLFFRRESFTADPVKSAEWNRGSYLVQGLGHCGACHTPRNALGAEKQDKAYAGGDAEGWIAPALNQDSPSPYPWTVERLVQYLHTGADDVHGAAAGPMAPVVHDLSGVPEQDVKAIAVYVASLDPRSAAEREKNAEAAAKRPAPELSADPGAAIYAGACAQCHGAQRAQHGALNLRLSSALALSTPTNAVRIIEEGIVPRNGERGAWMPSFAGSFTDTQLAALVDYLRKRFAGQPAWNDTAGELKKRTRAQVTQGGT